METYSLDNILDALPKINASRKYWFFRTNGGSYYDEFIEKGFISIGYNEISFLDIKSGNTEDETGIKILSEIIKKKLGDNEARPNYVAGQLLRFAYGIKKGDIVLIPSNNSEEITFGEVLETPAYSTESVNINECPFYKRKRVKWLRSIKRDKLDPYLYKLMFSHHTITEAHGYSQYIDKILNSVFIKDQKAHLILDVQTTDDIKAKDLFELGSITLNLLDEFCEEENLNYNSDDYNVKLNLQSPGLIELTGSSMGGIVIIGLIIVAIAGGGFSFKYKKDVSADLKSDGIIEKIRKFLNSNSNRRTKKEILEKHAKDLKINDPADLIKILRELDK